jgi:hypothetical protein
VGKPVRHILKCETSCVEKGRVEPQPGITQDRRCDVRHSLNGAPVRLKFQALDCGGLGQDLSSTGILVVAKDDLRVEVTVGDEVLSGVVVRLHPMPDGEAGWGIQFDKPRE